MHLPKVFMSMCQVAMVALAVCVMSSSGFASGGFRDVGGGGGGGSAGVPEIDAGSAASALALLSGGMFLVRDRMIRRRKQDQ